MPGATALKVGGIVLCGGQSRRMGQAKAWLPFGKELLLPRVVRLLSQVVEKVVVVAAPGQVIPPLPEQVLVVRDEELGRGPLQGLAAGLKAFQGQMDAVYLSGCDTPFLQPAFVLRLLDLLGNHAICVPHVGEYFHTLAAVYRLDVLPAVENLLQQNRLRPVFLFEAVPTRMVTAAELCDLDADFQTLRNLNTPDDYEAALRMLAQGN